MTNKRPVTEVDIPDVQHCPNCGHHILIGDLECSNCGYDVATVEERLRRIDPVPVAIVLGIIGIIVTISGLTMDEGILQILVILTGGGLFLSGGGVIVMNYFLNDPMRKRD